MGFFDVLGDIAGGVLTGGVGPLWKLATGGSAWGPGGDILNRLLGGDEPPGAPKITPPPPAPDLADEAIRKARVSQRRRSMIGQGLGQTLFTGPLGDTAPPSTSKPTLGGY